MLSDSKAFHDLPYPSRSSRLRRRRGRRSFVRQRRSCRQALSTLAPSPYMQVESHHMKSLLKGDSPQCVSTHMAISASPGFVQEYRKDSTYSELSFRGHPASSYSSDLLIESRDRNPSVSFESRRRHQKQKHAPRPTLARILVGQADSLVSPEFDFMISSDIQAFQCASMYTSFPPLTRHKLCKRNDGPFQFPSIHCTN